MQTVVYIENREQQGAVAPRA